jgi:phenol 2-monooxygenase (NADPH)
MSLIADSHISHDYHLARNRNLAQPLPRLTPNPDLNASPSNLPRHEVVVVGAGPAGLFLTLLLARYGLLSTPSYQSLLCVDAAPHALKTGHADGIFPRTIEVLRTLNLEGEIMRHAAHVRESATWTQGENGLVRAEPVSSLKMGDYRFGEGFECIHQGRMERILEDDLKFYSESGVQRDTRCVGVRVDESDEEFPVVATLEHGGERREVRTKYLVGADGGRSNVRSSLGIKMEGETSDDVWGVVDLVVDSDYPDLRRQSFIAMKDGRTILHIPREERYDGTRLTRFYVPFGQTTGEAVAVSGNGTHAVNDENGHAENGVNGGLSNGAASKHRESRGKISLDMILEKLSETLHPFSFKAKEGTEVEWWTVYQVGQRLASQVTVKDSKLHPRVFLAGDACHTHSPKLGQGMNVSMMDSFDLGWKLAHTIFGLADDGTKLLDTYEQDRGANAEYLVNFDKWWYKRSYGAGATPGLSRKEFRSQMIEFITGVGIEYQGGALLTDARVTEDSADAMLRYSAGAWREGRRMEDALVKTFVDGCDVHLHDQIGHDSRYSLVVWTGKDLLKPDGSSQIVLKKICEEILPSLPAGLVKLYIVHSLEHLSFDWKDLPSGVKARSEMKLFHAEESQYDKYGVDIQAGRICVVRPDMFIGSIAELSQGAEGLDKVTRYLQRGLKTTS